MLYLLPLLCYVLVGIISGVAGGMLGIGGGVIAVPALAAIFSLIGLPQAYLMHLAVGTSLAAMVLNTISATWAHNKKKAVLWDVVKKMLLGVFIGSIFGSFFADTLSSILLEVLFGLFSCLLGINFLRRGKKDPEAHRLPSFGPLTLITSGIAGLANILGIGGGMFTVPFLVSRGLSDKNAIGTSVAVTFFISLAGAISYLVLGLRDTAGNTGFMGYIYLPAFFVIGITSLIAAPYGVKLAHFVPAIFLRKIFGYTMIAIGLLMIFT